jgi:cytosine deaminase
VNCSLSSNNILNPATPYGDCSLIRMANLYANVLQVDRPGELRDCFEMLTHRSARLMNLKDYGFRDRQSGDVVIIDAQTPSRPSPKSRGRSRVQAWQATVAWERPRLMRPN